MTTNNFKSLVVATLLGAAGNMCAQSLTLKGQVKNAGNETTSACYTLYNPYELLQVGTCQELRLELTDGDSYTLTFSKPGFRSKTIQISTFCDNHSKYRLSFNVTLMPLKEADTPEADEVAGKIYYDIKKSDYNYLSYAEMAEKHSEKSGSTHKRFLYTLK